MKPYHIIFIVLSLLICSSCAEKPKEDKQQLTVTIEPIKYFTEALVGDKYTVNVMVPNGTSPETYDPTPQQLVRLSKSKALFYTGYLGFEQLWMERLQENAPETTFYNLSKGIPLIQEEKEHEGHTHKGGIEPHIWNSPNNALVILKNIYMGLIDIDPENKDFYKENYELEKQKIASTSQHIASILNESDQSKAFMIYHPALSYFAQEYGLIQLSIEEGGKEPSPFHLKELIKTAKENNVKVIFIQPEFDQKNAAIIAKEIGAILVPINPLSYNWHEEIIHIAEALK